MEMLVEESGAEREPEYLSTHPGCDARIARQKEWIDSALQVNHVKVQASLNLGTYGMINTSKNPMVPS